MARTYDKRRTAVPPKIAIPRYARENWDDSRPCHRVSPRRCTYKTEVGMDRDEILGRYRNWREICLEHHNTALSHVSRPGLMDNARRLGIAEGRTTLVGCEGELTLVVDLALYTSRAGRSRALDRYARSARPIPDSPEALMLSAMQRARFSVWTLKEHHDIAGLMVEDFFTDQTAWLVDLGLESSAPIGSAFAARVCQPDVFSMTNGVTLPLNREIMEELLAATAWFGDDPEHFTGDARFITALYRIFVELGLMDDEPSRDVDDQPLGITLGAASSQRASTRVPGL